MNFGRIILATLIITFLQVVWGWSTHGWLFSWLYQLQPVEIWRAHYSHLLIIFTSFIFTFFFVLFFAVIRDSLPSKGIFKGLWYGFFIWFVGYMPGILLIGLTTIISHVVISYWILDSLFINLCSGLVVAITYRQLNNNKSIV